MQQHDQIDAFTRQWTSSYLASGKTLYCRKGCAGCCSLAVHATYLEAARAAAVVSVEQRDHLEGYVARLKNALPAFTDLKGYLKAHRKDLGPCPFLDAQGTCSIYALRPLSCRALLSTRPAAWCIVDFAELDEWDKRTYESGLDRNVVSWPGHYVAATQDFGSNLERELLDTMQQASGWSASGNFSLMVWLALRLGEEQQEVTRELLSEALSTCGLDSELLLTFSRDT